ncbi:MAG: metal ABC transporter solute-binding protein, Zn/Mn family [Microbacteriaceae bacterium]
MKNPTLIALAAASMLVLAGCAPGAPAADGNGTVRVVAATNVYGSIAEAIGGDLITVTNIITSAAQDPHSYEASVQNQLAVSKAQLVIENGGGYDPFMTKLLNASSSTATVINATETSELLSEEHDAGQHDAGHDDAGHTKTDGHDHIEGFNEHVWYSPRGVGHVAEQIARELSKLDPENASTYSENLVAFSSELETLEQTAEALRPLTEGHGVAITEPVPLYLLQAAGLTNRTPAAFSEAIEEGTDVAPTALRDTLEMIRSGDILLLAYNSQTASPETEKVRVAAQAAGVAVVDFTETLPDDSDYVSWMTHNLAEITEAVSA